MQERLGAVVCGCVSGEKRCSGYSLVDVSSLYLSVPSFSVQPVGVDRNLIKKLHQQTSSRGRLGLSWRWLLAGPGGDEGVCQMNTRGCSCV